MGLVHHQAGPLDGAQDGLVDGDELVGREQDVEFDLHFFLEGESGVWGQSREAGGSSRPEAEVRRSGQEPPGSREPPGLRGRHRPTSGGLSRGPERRRSPGQRWHWERSTAITARTARAAACRRSCVNRPRPRDAHPTLTSHATTWPSSPCAAPRGLGLDNFPQVPKANK